MSHATATLPVSATPPATLEPRPWSRTAACSGKNSLFFGSAAERPETRVVRELKASLVCAGCPVLTPCRSWAREHGEFGYWGGESEQARAAAGFPPRIPRSVRRPRINPGRVA